VKPLKFVDAVARKEPEIGSGGVAVLPMYHCGAGTLNRNRNLERQFEDWKRIGEFLLEQQP
jgi:hypothetical protein